MRLKSTNGAVLILAIIMAAGLGLVLATALRMTTQELEYSYEHVSTIQSFHLSEAGIEATIAELSSIDDFGELTTSGWAPVDSGAFLVREFSVTDLGWQSLGTKTAIARVMIDNPANTTAIRIWSVATVSSNGANYLPKKSVTNATIEFTQVPTSTIHPFIGAIATDSILFTGNAYMDSFDSSVFPYAYTDGVNSGANASLATTSTEAGAIDISGGSVAGDVFFPGETAEYSVDGLDGISGTANGEFSFDTPPVIIPDTTGALTSFTPSP